MAALNNVAKEFADEIRDGIAWVIIWKTGRSWNGYAAWLDPDTDTFEPDDLETAREILAKDPNAVMLNGYYCGHFGEGMTVAEIAAGIRWHYKNNFNLLESSSAWPLEEAEDPYWEWHEGMRIVNEKAEVPTETTKSTPAIIPTWGDVIVQEMAENIQPTIDYVFKKARELIDWAVQVAGEFAKLAAESLSKFMDAMLYSANTHPKWWHLYKHAKKVPRA